MSVANNTLRSAAITGPFSKEIDLQRFVFEQDSIRSLVNATFVYARREVSISGCIPDVVYVAFAEAPNARLWPRQVTYNHCHILSLVRAHGPQTIDSIADSLFMRIPVVERLVFELVKSGALNADDGAKVRLTHDMKALGAIVIAVETKLKRWREAFRQALNYKIFANATAVVLNHLNLTNSQAIPESFLKLNVGLFATHSNRLESIIPFHIAECASPEHEYVVASAAGVHRHSWNFI